MSDYFPKWKLAVIALVAIAFTVPNIEPNLSYSVGYLLGTFGGLALFAAVLTAGWRTAKHGVSRARGQES
ncbi:hypothetical protein [Natrinema hispanicum]|uniref:Uncharacterized protein n=1 Tax=Natrinema hispanicum TaxID=392421 RepID=A0A1G6XNB1_9EURY|nr:hypothetical protein [Natrinema hispanicum]SDD79658.1 hypothetical protein SAMN05192552_10504 [Natrinema hispanicum]